MIIGIVAVDAANGIGINGTLPWPKLKEDLAWFKSKTENNIVLMGSNTWRSIGSKPLPNRINCVVSKYNKEKADYMFFDPSYGVEFCMKVLYTKDLYIIGGQKIYDSTMHFIDKWYITEIEKEYKCDKTFQLDYVKNNFPNKSILKTVEETESTPKYNIIEYTK